MLEEVKRLPFITLRGKVFDELNFLFTIKPFLWNLKIKSILVIGSKAFSPFYHNRLLLKKVFSMHFSITLYTLYVAYSFIHRLRYVMYIGYIEYTYVYLVWTYQLKTILCISNIILYVYMQICSVIRRFFLCVCSAKWDWVNRLCLNFFYIEPITFYYGDPACYMN